MLEYDLELGEAKARASAGSGWQQLAGGSVSVGERDQIAAENCSPRLRFEPPVDLGWLLPAVPEAVVVFGLVEGRIERSKAVPYALDCVSHVRPITVFAASRDETLIVQPVVDRPVSHVPTRV